MFLLKFSSFWGQNSVIPQFGGGGAEGSKTQKLLFFGQFIENLKLYNISKNQPPKSIKEGDMGFRPIFDLKKVLSFPNSTPN